MPENTNDPVAEVEAQVIYRCASYSPVVPADLSRSLARQLRDAHEALDIATNAQEDAERQLRDAREALRSIARTAAIALDAATLPATKEAPQDAITGETPAEGKG